ncbi:Hypothetical predicted protein [Octopus vulgaris]|uniref:Uncharacterized protein n=1 Tax=Octopus vulgaris TaxID=6645 RepID=A0AA36BQQ7_OCTVU|nr:Hypothetical predicted protein [Octopus vulgaris]
MGMGNFNGGTDDVGDGIGGLTDQVYLRLVLLNVRTSLCPKLQTVSRVFCYGSDSWEMYKFYEDVICVREVNDNSEL